MPVQLTDEQKRKIKQKEMLILKAQNQMLEEAKQSIRETNKIDDISKEFALNSVDTAIDENSKMASHYYSIGKSDMDKMKYNEPSQYYKDKYQERLKVKGLTDEELKSKKNDDATASVAGVKTKERRRKKKEYVQDIELETKLMNNSRLSDDNIDRKDIKENKKKEDSTNTKEVKDVVENDSYDFDFSSIPDYVQYDMIPLPSKGQCYPHKIDKIPVAYLTASDENLIASPNMYRDGKVIDVILGRKILDKRIKPNELCKGDRDAIVLWLRATGYGTQFPITATNPSTGKKYDIDFDLSTLKYNEFNLKGDEDGCFEYKSENGNVFKFKVLSYEEEEALKKSLINNRITISAYNAISHLNSLQECFNEFDNLNEEDTQSVNDCISDLKDIVSENVHLNDSDNEYEEVITKQMIKYTVSINGNADRIYIENFINNMRSKEAYNYRTHVLNNKPGVNFNITINIPERDGGGSFDTFLTTDDTIFLNI
jgi:hypothetical protein